MIWIALALAQDPVDTGLVEELPPPPPRPWEAPEDDAERHDVLGPWPDGYRPEDGFQRGLDVIDPLSGRVIEAGDPYVEGVLFGPEVPPDLGVEEQPLEETSEQVEGPVDEEPVEPAGPVEPVEPQVLTVQVESPAVEPREMPRQLPLTPEPSFRRALVSALMAVVMLLLIRGIERGPLRRLKPRGVLPLFLRGTLVGLRISTLAAVLIAVLMLLPRGLNPAPAYVFVGVALATGWTARDVLRDFIAGVVLVIEHKLVVDQRVELADHRGVVRGIGLRHVDLLDDSGQLVTIPNRVFLEGTLHTDPDRYVPVSVRIHVDPGRQAGDVRKALEELALLSPYLAPARSPEVHRDPSEADVWIVKARLVHPRYGAAFQGAMVELADEVLSA